MKFKHTHIQLYLAGLGLAILLLSGFTVKSETIQNGYTININISGLKDTTIYLAIHTGDKIYMTDTTRLDENGSGSFTADSLLPGGIYMIMLPENSYFDLLISNQQHFTLHTDLNNYAENLEVNGADETALYAIYQQIMIQQQKAEKRLRKQLSANRFHPDSAKIISEQLKSLRQKTDEEIHSLAEAHAGTFFAHVLRLSFPTRIPDFNIPDTVPNRDSVIWMRSLVYNQNHYFDQIAFDDPRLIHAPVLSDKISRYFLSIVSQQPDSIIKQVDYLISRAAVDKDMYRFVLSYLFNFFQTATGTGYEQTFLHLTRNYYLNGKAPWAGNALLADLRNRTEKIDSTLPGHQAPDLKYISEKGKQIALSDLKGDRILVYFWDPECSLCRQTTPVINELYNKYRKKGFNVYAVYTGNDKNSWLEYLDQHKNDWINVYDSGNKMTYRRLFNFYRTPEMILLGNNRTIIAKDLEKQNLINLLDKYYGNK